MRLKILRYSAFTWTRVSMDPGDRYDSTVERASPSIATYWVAGHIEDAEAPDARLHREGDGLILTTPEHVSRDRRLKASVYNEWICIGERDGKRPSLSVLDLRSIAELPPHTGLCVISGRFFADRQLIEPDQYFRPRDHVVPLMGHGTAITFGFEQ